MSFFLLLVQDSPGEALFIKSLNLHPLRSGYSFRPVAREHLPSLVLLEQRIYRAPWSPTIFHRLLNHRDYLFLGAFYRKDLIGYGCGIVLPPSFELHNVAVAPEHRGQGIARHLLMELFSMAQSRGAERIWLECRASNYPALELYRSLGFKPLGVRSYYYTRPSEDAIVLTGEIWNAL